MSDSLCVSLAAVEDAVTLSKQNTTMLIALANLHSAFVEASGKGISANFYIDRARDVFLGATQNGDVLIDILARIRMSLASEAAKASLPDLDIDQLTRELEALEALLDRVVYQSGCRLNGSYLDFQPSEPEQRLNVEFYRAAMSALSASTAEVRKMTDAIRQLETNLRLGSAYLQASQSSVHADGKLLLKWPGGGGTLS